MPKFFSLTPAHCPHPESRTGYSNFGTGRVVHSLRVAVPRLTSGPKFKFSKRYVDEVPHAPYRNFEFRARNCPRFGMRTIDLQNVVIKAFQHLITTNNSASRLSAYSTASTIQNWMWYHGCSQKWFHLGYVVTFLVELLLALHCTPHIIITRSLLQ